jgi:hypothetical protein
MKLIIGTRDISALESSVSLISRSSRWSLKTRNARGRSSNIKVKRASSLLHGVCGQSQSRWAPRSVEAQRPLSLLVVIQARIATGARYARGPFTHDEIRASCSETYVRAPYARACIRVVRPAAFFACPPFSQSVLLSARRARGIPLRLALAPRRSMTDAADIWSLSLSFSLSLCVCVCVCLRASALRVKVPPV